MKQYANLLITFYTVVRDIRIKAMQFNYGNISPESPFTVYLYQFAPSIKTWSTFQGLNESDEGL